MTKHDNRRNFERTELGLTVRFVTREDLETTGELIDISEGGLAMLTETEAQVGDPVIAYPEKLGRITGTVVRKFEGGVAIAFEMSDAQRQHLRKRIESAVSGVPYIRLLENRKHKRISEGQSFKCQIADISETGSQIRAEERPIIGTMVRVGLLRGKVRRHTNEGFAIEFSKPEKVAQAAASTAKMHASG